MKNSMVKLAVLSALGMVSAQAFATGLVAIPAAGFANSAYTLCVNACLEVHHSLRAKVHQFKTYF